MKRLFATFVAAAIAAGSMCACSKAPEKNGNLKIVTTIFPQYDWVMNVRGDNPAKADVTLLQDSGADLHSFQPTASDIMKISECDLFIYVGGESDEWVDDVLKEATNKNMVAINLMDALGDTVKEEEIEWAEVDEIENEDVCHFAADEPRLLERIRFFEDLTRTYAVLFGSVPFDLGNLTRFPPPRVVD